ncbi:MAG: DUF3570 domain-containing protein [Gammaproteobacteria bacterium]|nr:DUF3570 domain-containing protein [Gammaproteobacteria bacterium]
MQLKKRQIRQALATATCSLLAGVAAESQAKDGEWEVKASTLFYKEIDRINVYEETLSLKKELAQDESISLKRTHDIMTGASPTGAAAPTATQTFTTPSGSDVTNTAGESPLGRFQDIRTAYNVTWDKPMSRLLKASWAANFSYEYDYTSGGLSAYFSKDTEKRRVTWNFGASANYDRIRPNGGVPTGLAATTDTARYPSDQKFMMDWLLGFSSVINRNTLGSMTYMGGFSAGYMNDPYKVISRLNVDGSPSGSEQFEKRPDERNYNSLHWRAVHQRKESQYAGDVVDLSYRFYWDDWEMDSHTLEGRYRHDVKNGSDGEYWQGHARLYRQSAASFYHYGLPVLSPDPGFASADYRLATAVTSTLGLLYGRKIFKDIDMTVRGEYLRQWYMSGDITPLNAIAVQGSLYYRF